MESNSKTLIAIPDGWTQKEVDLLAAVEETGAKPISTSLAAGMFNLFIEGYSCSDIANNNKGLSEGDILYCRKKYKWDDKRDQYLFDLQVQAQQKLLKQRFESINHLTDMLSVIHKEQRDQVLKFLQSGNTEDFPKLQGIKFYKEIIETLQKVTGEDKVQKHKIEGTLNQNTSINIGGAGSQDLLKQILEPQNAAKVLGHLAKEE